MVYLNQVSGRFQQRSRLVHLQPRADVPNVFCRFEGYHKIKRIELTKASIRGQTTVEWILVFALVFGLSILFFGLSGDRIAGALRGQKSRIEGKSVDGNLPRRGYDNKFSVREK